MRPIAIWTLALLLAGPVSAQEVARVKSVTGDVTLKPAGTGKQAPAVAGQPIGVGDFLSTDVDSEAVLGFPQGADVRIFELSQVRVNEMFLAPDRDKLQLFLRTGKVETMTSPKPLARTDFSVMTPVATASIRGTHQIVRHGEGVGTDVEFLAGLGATMNNRGATVSQSGGQKSQTSANGDLAGPSETQANNSSPALAPAGRDNTEKAATAHSNNNLGDRTSGDAGSPQGLGSVLSTGSGPARLRLTIERVP